MRSFYIRTLLPFLSHYLVFSLFLLVSLLLIVLLLRLCLRLLHIALYLIEIVQEVSDKIHSAQIVRVASNIVDSPCNFPVRGVIPMCWISLKLGINLENPISQFLDCALVGDRTDEPPSVRSDDFEA